MNRPANQPGATTGGEAVQQVRPTGGSMMQQRQGQETQQRSNTNMSPRSTNQPVNQPGATTGGEAVQQVQPTGGSMMQQRQETQPASASPRSDGQPGDPAMQQMQPMNGSMQQQPGQGVYPRTNATPRSNNQPDNQPGVTTGGEATQEMQPNTGSSQQRMQTTPRSGNNGSDLNNRQSNPRSEAPSEGVRALW
jgi:hypothetical protein